MGVLGGGKSGAVVNDDDYAGGDVDRNNGFVDVGGDENDGSDDAAAQL